MCKACELKPVYEFTNKKKLCKRCFVKYFQKKFLHIVRKFNMIRKGDVVSYKQSSDFRNVVLRDLLDLFANKGVIEIVKAGNKKANKIAITDTLDISSNGLVHKIIKGSLSNLKEFSAINNRVIKPLYLFLDNEIKLYAELKNLKFKEKKIKRDKINLFIEEMEKKHPEIKRAIVNSYLEISA